MNVSCQEITFAQGTCRIEIESDEDRAVPLFTARLSLLDPIHERTRPIIFPGGDRVIIKAATEPATLRAAVAYRESRLGSLCEAEHSCSPGSRADGPPLVLEAF